MTMGVVFISIPTNRNRMTTRISNLNGDLILEYDGGFGFREFGT